MPCKSIFGSKTPEPLVSKGDQIPPVSGVPPILSNKSIVPLLLQIVTSASVPASGIYDRVTFTVAAASSQGGEAVKVYV